MSFIFVPTLLVFFGCLPIHNVFISKNDINLLDYISFGITFSGILFESIADSQLRQATKAFAKYKKTDSMFVMDKGLWSLCRHPNYFGEVTYWFGLFGFTISAGVEISLVQLVGPVGIFCIILFGSLPMMQERQINRKGRLFTDYMKNVPFKIFPLNFFGKNSKSQ